MSYPSYKIKPREIGDHGRYIRGLDGLRALAVISVLGYHIAPQQLPGGFLGVDLFFVLSGFLISTLLIRELRGKGKIALTKFWVRRARRLLPALFALVLVVVPLAWLVEADLLVGIRRQVLGALTFTTNWLEIAHGSSYFDATTPLLLKNFWSLAIEEQFYLFWPLLFICALALLPSLRARMIAVGGLALISAILMAVLYDPANITRVYYGTDTHLFGLAIGIIVAFAWADRASTIFAHPLWRRFGQLFGWLALAGIIAAICWLPDTSAFAYRGGIFGFCCLTAVVISAMLQPKSFLATIGEFVLLRWWGTRSYGIYLWHWPIIVIMSAAFPVAFQQQGYWIRAVGAIVVTLFLAEISFRYLETPIRAKGFRAALGQSILAVREFTWAKIISAILLVLLLLVSAGLYFAPAKSQTQQAIEAVENLSTAENGTGSAPVQPRGAAEKAIQKVQPITDPQQLSPSLNTTVPQNTEITVIGDSMFSAAKTGLDWAMPGVKFFGKSNRQWADAVAAVQAAAKQNLLGRTVVLAFGTNAGVRDSAQVEQVIHQLGADRMILLVNIYSPAPFVAETNKVLAQVAQKYVNVAIVDWHELVQDAPHLLQVDQTHPSIAGANALGKLIRTRATEFATQLSELKTSTKSHGAAK